MTIQTETYTAPDGTRTYQYTDDPADVTRIWWSVASESVQDGDPDSDEWGLHDISTYPERMAHVLDAISAHVADTYPNATDVYICDGGFQNQFTAFSPRIETEDAIPYEGGFDDMSDAEDRAIAAAFTAYPTPEGDN